VADEGHLAKLMEGVESWNEWRESTTVEPDLSNASFGYFFSPAKLSDADFSNTNLSHSDLSGADLNGANLSRANLKGANLSHSNLSWANLSDANLSHSNLNWANLSNANLNGSDLSRSDLTCADLSDASLSDADLSDADLSYDLGSDDTFLIGANFKRANLRNANFSKTDLSDVNLSGANLSGADLSDVNLSGANLSGSDLSGADLREVNLTGANLTGANLSGTDLSKVNLSEFNLSNANFHNSFLIASQLLRSDLTSVTLTGACIQDWNINGETCLDNVKCDHVYLKGEWSEQEKKYILSDRRPSDPNAIFAPGEFIKLLQEALETVDLIFTDGIDWQAFFQSFQELRSRFDDDISIQAIEKKSGGAFVIRLEVPPEADKAAIESRAKEFYSEKLRLLESNYQVQLQIQGENLEHERKRNSQLMRVVEVMAENTGSKYDLRNANIGNLADTVKDNARQQTNQYNYESPEKQSLAEAAIEIQRLLKVLEETNPTATEADKKNFVSLAVSPTLKQRAVGALQSGGKAALEEFLDNPYVNVGVAIVEGWREPK
jgi:uncharacterized protein YjbI with pentapeptide repeats